MIQQCGKTKIFGNQNANNKKTNTTAPNHVVNLKMQTNKKKRKGKTRNT